MENWAVLSFFFGWLKLAREKTIAPLFIVALYSSAEGFASRPPTGFCNEFLIGSKYEWLCIVLVVVRSPGFEPGSSGWEPDVLTKLD